MRARPNPKPENFRPDFPLKAREAICKAYGKLSPHFSQVIIIVGEPPRKEGEQAKITAVFDGTSKFVNAVMEKWQKENRGKYEAP